MNTVTHQQLGTGTVIEQDEKTVTVNFNGTIKKLMTAFAKLTNEDGTPFGTQFVAPVKKRKVKVYAQISKNKMSWNESKLFQEEMQRREFDTISW